MKIESITDVFFDLDHTLWDFEKNSELAFGQIFAESYPDLPISHFLEHYIPINREFWQRYQRNEISQEDLRYGRLLSSFEKLGRPMSREEAGQVSVRYIDLLPENNHLFEGTLEILDYLSSRYTLHIITNGFSQVQQKKLEKSGIASYFATVSDSESTGFRKPDRRMYENALEAASARAETSVMIGDCLEADVKGSMDCGIRAFWFANGSDDIAPEGALKLDRLFDIKLYL